MTESKAKMYYCTNAGAQQGVFQKKCCGDLFSLVKNDETGAHEFATKGNTFSTMGEAIAAYQNRRSEWIVCCIRRGEEPEATETVGTVKEVFKHVRKSLGNDRLETEIKRISCDGDIVKIVAQNANCICFATRKTVEKL